MRINWITTLTLHCLDKALAPQTVVCDVYSAPVVNELLRRRSDRPVIGGDLADTHVPPGWGGSILMCSQLTQPREKPVTVHSGDALLTWQHSIKGHATEERERERGGKNIGECNLQVHLEAHHNERVGGVWQQQATVPRHQWRWRPDSYAPQCHWLTHGKGHLAVWSRRNWRCFSWTTDSHP